MREAGWPERLNAEIEKSRKKKFKWGEFDCWLFVAACVKAMTGIDYAEKLRGTYHDMNSAKAIIGRYGSEHEMLENLGFNMIQSKRYAQRGDIVMIRMDDWCAGGICIGSKAIFAGPDGLTTAPIESCEDTAYRV